MRDLSDKVEFVEISNKFLTDQQANDLVLALESARVDVTYLSSQDFISEKAHEDITAKIDGYRSFVINFNNELDRKQTKQKLQTLRNEILHAHEEVIATRSSEQYFSKWDFFNWKNKWGYLVPPIIEAQRKMVVDVDFSLPVQHVADFYTNGEELYRLKISDSWNKSCSIQGIFRKTGIISS